MQHPLSPPPPPSRHPNHPRLVCCSLWLGRWVHPFSPDTRLLADTRFLPSRRGIYLEEGAVIARDALLGQNTLVGAWAHAPACVGGERAWVLGQGMGLLSGLEAAGGRPMHTLDTGLF